MKRLLTVALLCASTANAADLYYKLAGGKKMVDVYQAAAALGVKVDYKTTYLILSKGSASLRLTAGTTAATYNGQRVTLPSAMQISGNALVIDVAVFSKYFGLGDATLKDANAPAQTPKPTLPQPSKSPTTPTGTAQADSYSGPEIRLLEGSGTAAENLYKTAAVDWSPVLNATPERVMSTCMEAIKAILKSPATASFVTAYMSKDPNKIWHVFGSVDAQNSYGALVRGNYTCILRAGEPKIYVDVFTP